MWRQDQKGYLPKITSLKYINPEFKPWLIFSFLTRCGLDLKPSTPAISLSYALSSSLHCFLILDSWVKKNYLIHNSEAHCFLAKFSWSHTCVSTMDKGGRMEDVASWPVVDVACAGNLGIVTQETEKPPKSQDSEHHRLHTWRRVAIALLHGNVGTCWGSLLMPHFTSVTYLVGSHHFYPDPQISEKSQFFSGTLASRILHYAAWRCET